MLKCLRMALAVAIGAASFTIALSEEPLGVSEKKSGVSESIGIPAAARPSLESARHQAKVLHTAMHSTLQVVHHQYYREDEGLPIPARTLKDVFAELEKEHHIKLRWLAVEGQAMNTAHKPQDSFENEAVNALKSGRREFERVEHGVYRRAGSITLLNHCLKCHVPDRKSTEARTAGLVIAIPIEER